MRKLKIFKHISLDGVIQVRGSGEDGERRLRPCGRLSPHASSPRLFASPTISALPKSWRRMRS
jgi:hypothetical protein